MQHFNTTPLGEMQSGEMQFGEMQLSPSLGLKEKRTIGPPVSTLNISDAHWILFHTVSVIDANIKGIPYALLYRTGFFYRDFLNHHRGRNNYTNPLINQQLYSLAKWSTYYDMRTPKHQLHL
ncbi:hypothetical protein H8356DRAFT_1356922 [Neocallimastix lanati (nom. inval.)]|nr:hypothetical protein H8356DRAFT_1356922 [Neocallimastix sp. JGI-2020a]